MRDLVHFKGETFEIDSGATLADVLENMKQLFPSAADATGTVSFVDGRNVFTLKDKPGEKG